MHIKNFLDFLSEGASYNKDRDKAVLTSAKKDDDLLSTTVSKYEKKGYRFKVYYGLESINSKNDLKNQEVKGLMDLIKQGKIELPKMASGHPNTLFKLIKNSVGAQFSEIKYIVTAESSDPLAKSMAEDLKANIPGAVIIELNKKEYKDANEILRDEYKLSDAKKDAKELAAELDELLIKAGRNEKKGGSRDRLLTLISAINETPLKITSYWNHVREFLQSKYHYSEEFSTALIKCFNTRDKMIIIDDNLQSGTDFREIMGECGRTFDILSAANKEKIDDPNTDTEYKEILSRMYPKQNNVFGFVLYKIKGKDDKKV